MSSTDISDSSTSDTSMATPLSSPPSTSSSSLSPAVTPHAVHHNRLLSCAVQTYDFVRSVTIVFPGVLLAVVAYWLKTETLCQGVQRPDFCHRVVWLTFPLVRRVGIFLDPKASRPVHDMDADPMSAGPHSLPPRRGHPRLQPPRRPLRGVPARVRLLVVSPCRCRREHGVSDRLGLLPGAHRFLLGLHASSDRDIVGLDGVRPNPPCLSTRVEKGVRER
ncbi:hypothetical protein ED733_001306 [Metarhizium rileyi]|uniref:Uncharacterized protein n=1 Tax=Metarhizium rileyi (strain RCEF 4871) TaxID=1649241 RepID=A0A5C6G2Z1_METRR|nr:hypothetical protein ED733_001306 [Metarhizium rileyi]